MGFSDGREGNGRALQEGIDAKADGGNEMADQKDIGRVQAHVSSSRTMLAHLVERESGFPAGFGVDSP